MGIDGGKELYVGIDGGKELYVGMIQEEVGMRVSDGARARASMLQLELYI